MKGKFHAEMPVREIGLIFVDSPIRMKRMYILLFGLLSFGLHVSLWGQVAEIPAALTFDPPSAEFQEVEMGTVVEQEVRFQNTSGKEMIVSHVKPGCGCTKVAFEADTLAQGEWGSFRLIFDTANRLGKENLSASVMTNVGKKIYKWRMTGTVVPVKETSEKAESGAEKQ